MDNVDSWASLWGVPPEALNHLRAILNNDQPPLTARGTTETASQNAERVRMSHAGGILWRNNVGAYQPDNGGWVRYGLCNESKNQNISIKSSDLIGLQSVLITPAMVGCKFGRFVAREAKKPGWTYSGRGREPAQLKYINLVNSYGGDAAFCSNVGT